MFAIIETGGKQYRVSEGTTIKVEKVGDNEGEEFNIDSVLFLHKESGEILVGAPILSGVSVLAKVVKMFKTDKVIDFTKRRRKNSRRKNGHRQTLMELKILNIKIN